MNSGNDFGQAINLQSQRAADAMREYLEEMTRIARLAEQTTREAWDKKGRLLRRPKLAPEGAVNLQSRRQRGVP